MPVYEIINPSDAYTIEGDFKACAIATVLLGEGQYALRDEDDEQAMPLFLLGGHDEWFREQFGGTFEETLKICDWAAVVAALESVLIGKFASRAKVAKELAAIPEAERAAWLAKRHDKKRSSMNNIGGYARLLADGLRKQYLTAAL